MKGPRKTWFDNTQTLWEHIPDGALKTHPDVLALAIQLKERGIYSASTKLPDIQTAIVNYLKYGRHSLLRPKYYEKTGETKFYNGEANPEVKCYDR